MSRLTFEAFDEGDDPSLTATIEREAVEVEIGESSVRLDAEQACDLARSILAVCVDAAAET